MTSMLRHHPNGADGFDRFMSRAVFANADGVVRENVDIRQLRQRCQPNRGAAIIGEDGKVAPEARKSP